MDRVAATARKAAPKSDDLPEHLDPNALRASASLGDWGALRSVLQVATISTLRRVVLALLATEGRYDWVGAEEHTRPAVRTQAVGRASVLP